MSLLLTCPNCGPRDVSEFSYGGQIMDGPANLPEVQSERWYHRFGCRRWLRARRDVRTNAIQDVVWLEDRTEQDAAPAGGA